MQNPGILHADLSMKSEKSKNSTDDLEHDTTSSEDEATFDDDEFDDADVGITGQEEGNDIDTPSRRSAKPEQFVADYSEGIPENMRQVTYPKGNIAHRSKQGARFTSPQCVLLGRYRQHDANESTRLAWQSSHACNDSSRVGQVSI